MDSPAGTSEDESGQGGARKRALSATANLSKLREKLFPKQSRHHHDPKEHSDTADAAPAPTQADEVDSFLRGGPPIPMPSAAPRRNLSLLAPRLDLAAAARHADGEVSAEQRWKPSKPRRRPGLKVGFDLAHVEVIGRGGEDAGEPVAEIGRARSAQLRRLAQERMTAPPVPARHDHHHKSAAVDHAPVVRPATGNVITSAETPSDQFLSDTMGSAPTLAAGMRAREGLRLMRAAEGQALRLSSVLIPDGEEAPIAPLEPPAIPARPVARPEKAHEATPEQILHHDSKRTQMNETGETHRPTGPVGGSSSTVPPPDRQHPALESRPKPRVQPPPVAAPSMPQADPDRGDATISEVQNSAKASAGQGPAQASFGLHVSHLSTIFQLASPINMGEPGPSDWARAATWWFLRARLGLEEMVRAKEDLEHSAHVVILSAHQLSLAKVWWILVCVLPAFSTPEMTPSAAKTQHSLGYAFEALLRSMERRDLLPQRSIEVVTGQNTSVWTTERDVDRAEIGAKFRQLPPATSIIRLASRDTNAFAELLIEDTAHHKIVFRAFAQALANPAAGRPRPDGSNVVLLTAIRPLDSIRHVLMVTNLSHSLDFVLDLDPNSAISSPSQIFARLNPRSSSISMIRLSSAADEQGRLLEIALRPPDFAKLDALESTFSQAVINGSPQAHNGERGLASFPLQSCFVKSSWARSPWSVQACSLHVFQQPATEPHAPDATREDSHASHNDSDSEPQSKRDRLKTQLHLGASIINKSLTSLRDRRRAHDSTGTGSGGEDDDDDTDVDSLSQRPEHDDLPPQRDETRSSRHLRLAVVSDPSARRIDSTSVTFAGGAVSAGQTEAPLPPPRSSVWRLQGVAVHDSSPEPARQEATAAAAEHILRITGVQAGAADPGLSDKQHVLRQEMLCVFGEARQRDAALGLLQTLLPPPPN